MKCKKTKQSIIAGNDGAVEREHMEQCSHCSGLKTLVGDMEEAGSKLRSVDMSEFTIAKTRSEVASVLNSGKEEAAGLQKEPMSGISFARIYAAAAVVLFVVAIFFMAGPLHKDAGDVATGVQPVRTVFLNRQIDELRLKIDHDIASLSEQFEESARSSYLERARDELRVEMAMARAHIDELTGGNRL